MALWLAVGVMTLAVLAMLLAPFLRGAGDGRRRADYDLAVYRDQLDEVERDHARGLLNDAEARAAKIEIQRRILALDQKEEGSGFGPRGRLAVAAVTVVAVPAAALAVYVALGTPSMPSQPFVERQAERLGTGPLEVRELMRQTERLTERLARDPADPEGWIMLGRAHATMGRPGQAAEAYRQGITQGARGAGVFSAYGEALVAKEGGRVNERARRAFRAAYAEDPRAPRARFYLGLAEAQGGDAEAAMAIWRDLDRDSTEDAPWLPMLRTHMASLAQEHGIDIAAVTPRPPVMDPAPGGTGDRIAALTESLPQLSGEEREMVETMVARLAERMREDPEDAEGWLRLGRSYMVLGDARAALPAYAQAVARAPDDIDAKQGYVDAALETLEAEGADVLPPPVLDVLRDILAAEPEDGRALYFIGLAEAEAGDRDAARAYWTRLARQLPEGSEARGNLENMIDALE